MLPIAWSRRAPAKLEKAERDLRRIGRALGRARAIDVALEVLPRAEQLIGAARAIARLRADLLSRQGRERRRVIKRLEEFVPFDVNSTWSVDRLLPAVEWRTDPRWRELDAALVERADLLKAAITASGGVYFPNRTHGVRLQAKKLRYLLDLVPTSGVDVQRAIKRLRKAQEVLGDVHDRQATADVVAEGMSEAEGDVKDEYRALHDWLTADVRDLHAGYLAHRDPLLQVCANVRQNVANEAYRPVTVGRTLLAVGALAAPPAAALLKRRLALPRSPESLPHRIAAGKSLPLSEEAERIGSRAR